MICSVFLRKTQGNSNTFLTFFLKRKRFNNKEKIEKKGKKLPLADRISYTSMLKSMLHQRTENNNMLCVESHWILLNEIKRDIKNKLNVKQRDDWIYHCLFKLGGGNMIQHKCVMPDFKFILEIYDMYIQDISENKKQAPKTPLFLLFVKCLANSVNYAFMHNNIDLKTKYELKEFVNNEIIKYNITLPKDVLKLLHNMT